MKKPLAYFRFTAILTIENKDYTGAGSHINK